MNELQVIIFWLAMLTAQAAAFLLFKDLADVSQWLLQSRRAFTMGVWYHRHSISGVGIVAMILSLVIWFQAPSICPGALLTFLVFLFLLNFYAGMVNPKWMFRSQQHAAQFVPVAEARPYLQRSLPYAHFGPESYASVDAINVVVLETDDGAHAYSDYYLLQPHVVKGGSVAGEAVVMTYCGLTNLAIAYSPVLHEQALELTVMTQLKNNLVLYDKNSGEPIQQILGSMERDGSRQRMQEWPTIRMPFSAFAELYPHGKVFINEIAGFGDNPVLAVWDRLVRHVMMLWGVGLNWIDNDKPAFPTVEYRDKRLPMKELIYAITLNGDSVAYSKHFIIEQGNIINVNIGGKDIVLGYEEKYDCVFAFFNPGGTPVNKIDIFGNMENGIKLARVNTLKSRLFWFIYVAFYPDTDVNRV